MGTLNKFRREPPGFRVLAMTYQISALWCKKLLLRSWRFHLGVVGTACALLLSGCGGGGGSGSNAGQKPDPVVVDLPLAYVQRPIPLDEDGNPVYPDVFSPASFNPGGELFIKDRATVQANVVNVTAEAFKDDPNFTADTPNYDVKDVSASLDGKKLVFAMRAPEDPNLDEDEQPTWNIWVYELETKTLRRVISSNFEAEKGDDLSPHYLPDGRILFASNRQKRSREILLDEGKPQFSAVNERDGDIVAFELHVMKDDGTDIEQITFNQSHDYQPSLLADGRILYVRWDGFGTDQLSFYTANPDGTNVQRYFGADTLNQDFPDQEEPARLFKPQPLPDGRIAAIYMLNETSLGGDMVVFDGSSETEGALSSISIKPVDITPGLVSLHGRFASLAPLFDGTNRLLVSWSQCRLREVDTQVLRPCLPTLLVDGVPADGYEEAPPLYGIWIYDTTNQTQLPVVLGEDNKIFTEAVALEDFANPPAYIAPTTDPDLAKQNVGILDIRSVYDLDGSFNAMNSGVPDLATMATLPPDSRPARFVRIVKAVSVPDDKTLDEQDDNIYGNLIGQVNGLQEILGYAPVEPDGSVHVKVPADVAFTLEVLDAEGKQISRNHTNWLTLRPGETRSCNGCHDPQNTEVVHGRQDLEPTSINSGAAGGGQFLGTLRVDSFGTPDPAEPGETMAQFASRSYFPLDNSGTQVILPACGVSGCQSDDLIRKLSVDLDFTDEWTASLTYDERNDKNRDWRYNSLVEGAAPDQIPAPTPSGCRTELPDENPWNANCRIVINYEYHIQPLWERTRASMTVNNPDTMVDESADSCVGCHSETFDDAGTTVTRVPPGQLELDNYKQQVNSRMRSYTELLNNDNKQQLNEDTGLLEDILVPDPTGACNLDINGDPIVDENGVCTDPVLVPVNQPASMSRGGARASSRFFDKFAAGGSHEGFLNPAELKLLSEWLDTNAQYYANPFELAIPN